MEGGLPLGRSYLMNNGKFWLKVLRISAAVLTMVAQVILACMG